MKDAPKVGPILLLLPEFDTFASQWWVGNWSYVEKQWVVRTPYSVDHKSVVASGLPQPIDWAELPRIL